MYMVWFACNMVSTVIIYFVIPETKQHSLGEIGELFGDKVVVHMTADGNAIMEKDKVANMVLPAVETMELKAAMTHRKRV